MAYKPGDDIVSTSIVFKIASFIVFYILLYPLAWIVCKVWYRFKIHGQQNLKGISKAVSVSNHTMFFDPVIIATVFFPKRVHQTLLEATVTAPFLGTLTRLLGGVPIPRRDTGFAALKKGGEVIFKNGGYFHFYPEGECYLYNNVPKKFHPGAFVISVLLDVPVVPIVSVFHEKGKRPSVDIFVMEPVYPNDFGVLQKDNSINKDALNTYIDAVYSKILKKIQDEKGTGTYYRGAMERIPGINKE